MGNWRPMALKISRKKGTSFITMAMIKVDNPLRGNPESTKNKLPSLNKNTNPKAIAR